MDLRKQYNIKSLKRRRAVYRMLFPRTLQNQYRGAILRVVNDYKKHFIKLIYPHLSELKTKYKKDSWYDDLAVLMRAINFDFSRQWTPSEISIFVKSHGKDISKWNKLINWCRLEIEYRSQKEQVLDDILANKWNMEGAELYNFCDNDKGETVCLSELKKQAIACGFRSVVRA